MRIFAGEWVKNILTRLGMQEGEAIESRMVTRRIEGAQKKVEERNFEIRKNLLEYDEVMDEQRKRVYGYRQRSSTAPTASELILDMIDQQIEHYLDQFLAKDYGTESFAEWAGKRAVASSSTPATSAAWTSQRPSSYAKDEAERMAEGQVLDADRREPARGRRPPRMELGGAGQDGQHPLAAEPARPRPEEGRPRRRGRAADREGPRGDRRRSTSAEGARFLEPDFGVQTACGWVQHKFGIELDLDEVRDLEPRAVQASWSASGPRQAYDEKEIEYPVMAGLYHFTTRDAGGHKRYDREKLVDWARERFDVELSRRRPARTSSATRSASCWSSTAAHVAEQAKQAMAEADAAARRAVRPTTPPTETRREPPRQRQAASRCPTGSRQNCDCELAAEEMAALDREQLERRLTDGRRRPLSGPKCGRWNGPWSCRCSTRPGKTTCWRWTTCAAASACGATPRSIPRSSTSAKACGPSRRCGTRSASG